MHRIVIIDGEAFVIEDDPTETPIVTAAGATVTIPATHRRKIYTFVETPERMAEVETMIGKWCKKHKEIQ